MVLFKEWFTVNEAAEYLRVKRWTIYKLIRDGRLPAYRLGQRHHQRFRKEDLDRVLLTRPTKVLNSEMAVTASADPVLAELWDNELDSIYDRV